MMLGNNEHLCQIYIQRDLCHTLCHSSESPALSPKGVRARKLACVDCSIFWGEMFGGIVSADLSWIVQGSFHYG